MIVEFLDRSKVGGRLLARIELEQAPAMHVLVQLEANGPVYQVRDVTLRLYGELSATVWIDRLNPDVAAPPAEVAGP